jgi:hypothetical protein
MRHGRAVALRADEQHFSARIPSSCPRIRIAIGVAIGQSRSDDPSNGIRQFAARQIAAQPARHLAEALKLALDRPNEPAKFHIIQMLIWILVSRHVGVSPK